MTSHDAPFAASVPTPLPPDAYVEAEFLGLWADVLERHARGQVDFDEASCILFSLLHWRNGTPHPAAPASAPELARRRFVGDLMERCWL